MSTYNTVIKKRNSSNNGWDSILPITIADNVLMGEGGETVASQLAETAEFIDINSHTPVNLQIHDLLRKSYAGKKLVTYIMVGDSTRASHGAYIYSMVNDALKALRVDTYLSAMSGLRAEHWGSDVSTLQPGYIQAKDLINLIPDDGTNTIVDICLGLNDTNKTSTQIKEYITHGIDIIKDSKPNIIVNLTSPNRIDTPVWTAVMKTVYDELASLGEYGYINVVDNVFKEYGESLPYFLDTWHPNELGQRKMAEYILGKLIPEDIKTKAVASVRVLQGDLSSDSVNDVIRASGLRCEVVYTQGSSTGAMYITKIANDWYLFDATSGNSLTANFKLTNGINIVTKDGYVSSRKANALVFVEDEQVLKDYVANNVYFPIENAVVGQFTPYRTLDNTIKDLVLDNYDYNNTKKFTVLKGHISSSDLHFAELTGAGIRVEIKQTGGDPYVNLYLNKISGSWYLFKNTTGSSISNPIPLVNGVSNITKASYETATNFEGQISIDDVTVLNNFTSGDYILLENVLVTDLSVDKTIKDHIVTLYQMLNTQ